MIPWFAAAGLLGAIGLATYVALGRARMRRLSEQRLSESDAADEATLDLLTFLARRVDDCD